MNIKNTETLIAHISEKEAQVKFIFFWGHKKAKDKVTKSCFSQWYESSFSHDGIHYKTAEHFMMAEKAKLFGSDVFSKIIEAKDPGKAKKLGREIKNFDEQIWLKHRFDIVVKANYLKFSQNPELKQFLLSTDYRVLVEASPVDPIWGIGMATDHPDVTNPERWKGLNLLGFALMQVRDQLLENN